MRTLISTVSTTACSSVLLWKLNYDLSLAHTFLPSLSLGSPSSANISLRGETTFNIYVDDYLYGCPDLEFRWEILRKDGLTEVYTIINGTYHHRSIELSDIGLFISGYQFVFLRSTLTFTPTDLRYDAAQLRAVLDVPSCFNISISGNMTLNIQGYNWFSLKIIIMHNYVMNRFFWELNVMD